MPAPLSTDDELFLMQPTPNTSEVTALGVTSTSDHQQILQYGHRHTVDPHGRGTPPSHTGIDVKFVPPTQQNIT